MKMTLHKKSFKVVILSLLAWNVLTRKFYSLASFSCWNFNPIDNWWHQEFVNADFWQILDAKKAEEKKSLEMEMRNSFPLKKKIAKKIAKKFPSARKSAENVHVEKQLEKKILSR